MNSIQKTTWVPYTPEQMYRLVNDLEKYPEFVPFCTKTVVYSRTEEEVRASLEFSKKGFTQSFGTINHIQKNKRIDLNLLEGPFRHLRGFWLFEEKNKGCQVSFEIEFQLMNRFLDMTVGPFIQSVTSEFVAAFSKRADSLYK